MIKKLVSLFIIFNYIILSISFVSAKPDTSGSPEEFVKEFLCVKMYTLVSKEIDDIDKYYSMDSPNSQKYMMFTKQNLLQDYLIAYASNDYVIEKVSPQVKIISSITKGDTATVEANLKTNIYWNASNALGKPIIGFTCEKHLLILNNENSEWKIIVDQFMTDHGHSDQSIKEDYTRMSDTIEKLKKEAQESIDRSKRSMPTKLTMISRKHNKNSTNRILATDNRKTNESRTTVETSYNRDAAYNWAHTYWSNYSTSYVDLGDQTWEGGDCTNFVSQCLKSGGANNDKIGSYQWYYDSKGTSKTIDDNYPWTWSTARGLNYILLGKYKTNEYGPKGTEIVITADSEYNSSLGKYLTVGDLIQYEWSASSKLKHSAIIVNMVFNSSKDIYEPVIATHTNDSWYIPWTKKAYRTHFVHITGIN